MRRISTFDTFRSALFLIFMDEILSLVGASPDTWDYAKSYLTIVSLGGPFVLISNCYSNVIRAEGRSSQAMMGQIIGNLLNVVLDPIMILGFGWNIAGAAIGTVIGNAAGALYYVLYFVRGKSILSVSIRDFTLKDQVCGGVLAIGVPVCQSDCRGVLDGRKCLLLYGAILLHPADHKLSVRCVLCADQHAASGGSRHSRPGYQFEPSGDYLHSGPDHIAGGHWYHRPCVGAAGGGYSFHRSGTVPLWPGFPEDDAFTNLFCTISS